jgi:long-subunit acyl-CoA synthetase (AMP-forming)
MPFDEDGWFSTGDVGHLDERGRLVLVGRTRQSINYGGEELDPTVLSNFWKDNMLNKGIEIEEMALVRDVNHGHSGQSAVLFCRVKQETLVG